MLIRIFNTNVLVAGENHTRVRWRMIGIVLVVPFAFLVRMVVVGVNTLVNLSAMWWLDLVYYTLFECIPLVILILLSAKRKNPNTLVKSRGRVQTEEDI